MTCYFRHLHDIFERAGVKVTKENRRQIDRLIHDMMGVEYKNCPAAWKEVKKRIAEEEEVFVSQLKKAVSQISL